MFKWQKYHIFDELATHNVEIELFNPLDYPSIDEANAQLLQRVKKNSFDLLMTTSTHKDLYIDTLEEIKKTGMPTLLICFDNLTIPFAHKKIASHFDLVWLTSIETKYLFDKWGVNSVFMPYAANPALYNPQTEEKHRVVFIGTPYGSRCKMLNTLLDAGINVDLYGGKKSLGVSKPVNASSTLEGRLKLMHSIKDMLRYPIGRRLALGSIKNKLMQMSFLNEDSPNLNHFGQLDMLQSMMGEYNSYDLALSSVTNRHTGVLKNPVLIVNLRNFEIAAAGGILFCQFNPELNSYFEDGKEAVYYDSDEDMIDKARFYLDNRQRQLRHQIKSAARLKAEHEHSWFNRFAVVFEKLGLSNYKP